MDSIKIELLANKRMPLLIRPTAERFDPLSWIAGNRDSLKRALLKSGGLLLRDFNLKDAASFEQFMKIVFGNLLEYKERSSPRNRVEGNIYTSTEYPADQSIFLHNENS